MRVLQIMSSCAVPTGVAQVIMNYYRKIKDKVTFDFLIFKKVPNSFEKEIKSFGGRVYYSGMPSIKKAKEYFEYLDNFFKKNAKKYDAVHLNELILSAPITHFAKKYGINKIVAHSHLDKTSDYFLKSIRNYFLFLPIRKRATLFLGCSKDAGKVFGKRIVNGKKFFVLNNAFDITKFEFNEEDRKRIRGEFGINDKTVLLGHAGRFAKQKNHAFLIDVFNEYHKLNANSKLLLVGSGNKKAEIEKKVKSLGLEERVIFVGSRNDLNKIYSAFDALVFPSFSEGLGNVVIEAQANGLHCFVSSAVPKSAFILKSCKKIDLKDGAKVWANSINKTKLKRSKDGLSAVKEKGYDINNQAEKLIALYKKA